MTTYRFFAGHSLLLIEELGHNKNLFGDRDGSGSAYKGRERQFSLTI